MAYLIGIPLLSLLAILQSSVVMYLPLLEARPDLVLLAIMAWAIVGESEEALIWAFSGGLILGLFSDFPFGTLSIVMVLIAFLLARSGERFWGTNPIMQLGGFLLGSVLFHAYSLSLLFLSGRPISLLEALTRIVFPSIFANLILGLPVLQLADGLKSLIHPPKVRI
jgi:rod shape-determining protein MreD